MGISKTSIIATIGPVTNNEASITALYEAGMTVARLNGSHGNLDWHRETIRLLRRTVPSLPILLDIPGRKIRTAQLDVEPSFERDDIIILTTEKSPASNGSSKVLVNFDRLHEVIRTGVTIFADDGTLSFLVVDVVGRDIHCRALANGTLKSRKGINVPELDLGQKLITGRDREMVDFAKECGVDFIGISFVESAKHVELIRELIDGTSPKIVSKIENQGGLDHMVEVIEASDVIMIDRGDLSVETSVDQVSLFQKRIIKAARKLRKPVIVATELLHTMIENPYPTKAEVSDVTNAVIDGAAVVMLSGETAVGKYPVQAVARLRSITDHVTKFNAEEAETKGDLAKVVKLLSRALPLTKVAVISKTGFAANLVASQRIPQPVFGVTDDELLSRSFNLLPGTQGVFLPSKDLDDQSAAPLAVLKRLWERGDVVPEDVVLVVGANHGDDRHYLNILQTYSISKIVEGQGWEHLPPANLSEEVPLLAGVH